MKAIGIICECNPFHKGHAYLIEQAKKRFPDKGVLCVMSGNFVQRGDFAIQEKYSRARALLGHGADLVLELPFPFSCLSAESFAKSAVSILSRIGVVDTLVFGSEIADEKKLSLCAERIGSENFQNELKKFLSENKGFGYPAAREEVYEKRYGKEPLLSMANASLGLEYLLAVNSLGADIKAHSVQRMGEGIHSLDRNVSMASASAIRKAVFDGAEFESLLPDCSLKEIRREQEEGRFPVSVENVSQIVFYLLKTLSRNELSSLYGFSSLCDRAKRFAGECETLEELVSKMKNGTVTDSRIRRGLMALLCRIPRFAEKNLPLYTLVLGANEKGRTMLSQMREESRIPVFTKPSHPLKSEDPLIRKCAAEEALAEEIYAMAFPKKQTEGFFLKQMPTVF